MFEKTKSILNAIFLNPKFKDHIYFQIGLLQIYQVLLTLISLLQISKTNMTHWMIILK